jgi:hypothetical protein
LSRRGRRATEGPSQRRPHTARAIGPVLDRVPVSILIYRLNELVYANRLFLRWTGCLGFRSSRARRHRAC